MAQNGQYSPDSQFIQSFPTEVAQNDLEWPISPHLQLCQSIPTEVDQIDSEWPILAQFTTFPIFFHQSGSE